MGSRNHSNYGSPHMNSPYQGFPQAGQPQHPSLQPRYMQVLAAEMKVYTAEVLKFQDEIRRLKYEIEELKAWKQRETAGVPVEWLPHSMQPALPMPDPEAPPLALEDYEPTRPAWRTVNKRPERKKKQKAIAGSPSPASPPPPTPPPQQMPGGFGMPSWAQWRPNPVFSPAPVSATPGSPLPGPSTGKAGLFGPPSPGPK